MAALNRFKSKTAEINEGTWVDLGDDFGNIGIKTRGFHDAYLDARQAKMRRAAVRYQGDVTKIPSADVRHLLVDLVNKHLLLDVRNLEDETGKPVSIDVFRELIAEDQYQDLYGACLAAANQITAEREFDLDDAKKNSAKLSA